MAEVTASVTAADSGTDWLTLRKPSVNRFTATVGGTFVATVTMKMKRAGAADATAVPLNTYTEPTGERGEMYGPWQVRDRVLTGAFTSGTVELAIYSDE